MPARETAWRRPRWLPKPHVVVMSVLFLGALFIGYALLPGERDRIAMLERDGQKRLALQALEKRYRAGDRTQTTLYQLQELYEQKGDLERAGAMLEQLAEARPRDAQVQRRLAAFYKATQQEERYLAALTAQVNLRYSDQACRELIGIHRLSGRHDAEQGAISLCRQKGYRRPEDLIRLATLQIASDDRQRASSLLRSIDDLRRLRTDRDKLRLFSLLLELDQPREAHRRAVRWLRGARDEGLALQLIEELVDDKRHDLAMQLARDVSNQGDAIALSVAELMLDRSQTVAARTYLRGWVEKADFAVGDTVSRFISASLDAEDVENAYLGASKYGLERLSQSDLVVLAEALAAGGHTTEFKTVRELVMPETVQGNPLLAAAMQFSQGSPDATRRLLAAVQVDDLDEWRLSLWTRLMEETGRSQLAAQTLRDLGAQAAPAPIVRGTLAAKRIMRPLAKAKRLRARAQQAQQQPAIVPPKAGSAQPKAAFDTQSVFGAPKN